MPTSEPTAVTIMLPDAEAMRELGAGLARACKLGTVLLLRGPLGAGKTTLVDGFVSALGSGRASSPSFVIAHSYPHGSRPVWHLDFYRLESDEIESLDLAQYVSPAAVTLVEWPERANVTWPEDRVEITMEVAEAGRRVQIRGFGSAASMVATATSAA